ncbi:thioredoxin family protein [candidate division WOR-3 bacterium]|nr:thioredoxin family protein [candidate division WOR-3 bacterium]
MKRKGVTAYSRIAAVILLLMIVAVVFIIRNKRETMIGGGVAADTNRVVEESAAVITDQPEGTTTESTFVEKVLPETLSDSNVENKVQMTEMNPLEHAFKKGLPIVADFGRGTCIPCKMMQPILEKLTRDFEGKASILILDIREFPALSKKYQITIIPSQIFFDAYGEEVHRHQGFMPEQDIINQLKKMGVE